MAVITLLDAQLAFGHVALLDHADFSLEEGERVGLIGRNGTGKSVLARLIAGNILPSSGRCQRNGSVYYLAQQISLEPELTVADLAGVRPILCALERIEHA